MPDPRNDHPQARADYEHAQHAKASHRRRSSAASLWFCLLGCAALHVEFHIAAVFCLIYAGIFSSCIWKSRCRTCRPDASDEFKRLSDTLWIWVWREQANTPEAEALYDAARVWHQALGWTRAAPPPATPTPLDSAAVNDQLRSLVEQVLAGRMSLSEFGSASPIELPLPLRLALKIGGGDERRFIPPDAADRIRRAFGAAFPGSNK